MSNQKIVIPEAMLEAIAVAVRNELCHNTGTEELAKCAAVAMASYLSENPILPTGEQCKSLIETYAKSQHGITGETGCVPWCVAEWQRLMFIAPKSEVPEEIKDLLIPIFTLGEEVARPLGTNNEYNHAIIEAFHRGQQSKETK